MKSYIDVSKQVIHFSESIAVADAIMRNHNPKTISDAQDTIKSAFNPKYEALFKTELENYLGYSSNSKSPKDMNNQRNGSSHKMLKTTVLAK